jgi:hypothetical protein
MLLLELLLVLLLLLMNPENIINKIPVHNTISELNFTFTTQNSDEDVIVRNVYFPRVLVLLNFRNLTDHESV